MDGYLSFGEKLINDFSEDNINKMYDAGFVFTRIGKGEMTQTRSIRLNLKKFELTSENRRVLKKTEGLQMKIIQLPHPDYDWRIHKMGFDFYTKKFGPKTFSANKIKELLTSENSNFNTLLEFEWNGQTAGYAICFENKNWLHYGYPFYDLSASIPNLGISMMTRAIIWAKEKGKKFVCLGSARNAAAVYKLQFSGVEWFDGKQWNTDLKELKKIL